MIVTAGKSGKFEIRGKSIEGFSIVVYLDLDGSMDGVFQNAGPYEAVAAGFAHKQNLKATLHREGERIVLFDDNIRALHEISMLEASEQILESQSAAKRVFDISYNSTNAYFYQSLNVRLAPITLTDDDVIEVEAYCPSVADSSPNGELIDYHLSINEITSHQIEQYIEVHKSILLDETEVQQTIELGNGVDLISLSLSPTIKLSDRQIKSYDLTSDIFKRADNMYHHTPKTAMEFPKLDYGTYPENYYLLNTLIYVGDEALNNVVLKVNLDTKNISETPIVRYTQRMTNDQILARAEALEEVRATKDFIKAGGKVSEKLMQEVNEHQTLLN